MAILLIGTLDTKGNEYAFLRDQIRAAELETLVINVGVSDILMMYSVVDVSGINRISRRVLTNAAQAMIGMVKGGGWRVEGGAQEDRPLVTATMFGVTTPCVEAARKRLDAAGYEVLV